MHKDQTNNRVQSQFDALSVSWHSRYKPLSDVNDIADYELVRRRALALDFLHQHFQPHEDRTILEVGCGTGDVISALLTGTTWCGIGLDISEKMIAHCQATYQDEERLDFEVHNLDAGPKDIQADAVVALGVVGYLSNPERAIDAVHHMLLPGGLFIFTINKVSVPRTFTQAYAMLRKGMRVRKLNRSFTLRQIHSYLDTRFEVMATRDYAYVPYVPILRKQLRLSKWLEKRFGQSVTRLSSTTMFVTRRV